MGADAALPLLAVSLALLSVLVLLLTQGGTDLTSPLLLLAVALSSLLLVMMAGCE